MMADCYAVRRVKMKLENIDVLKENMSKYCSVHYLASCILDNEECLNLYKTCKIMLNLREKS